MIVCQCKELSPISSSDDDDIFTFTQSSSNKLNTLDKNFSTHDDSSHPQATPIQPSTITTPVLPELAPEHAELTSAQKKKIHNRSCTIKQRYSYYRHELTFRNIDRRFTIRKIKNIL
ncbi:unnamed protein product [Rotaria magnacalcarata]|uniref:Uncharacterized protein n=2 Tax=Rotaria magnacalcarata TaxID=392030 RepID=A0A816YNV7_9BILA|nr:unnamed protein product [Rotaria magnacalcarata]CAF2233917.1 unnamed protein product [Rotaria magnacalcarata]